jgi:hypothetical protein
MKSIRIPGFTAEMSLYETAISYRTMVSRAGTRIITAVQPALMIGGGPLGATCTAGNGKKCDCGSDDCVAGPTKCWCMPPGPPVGPPSNYMFWL